MCAADTGADAVSDPSQANAGEAPEAPTGVPDETPSGSTGAPPSPPTTTEPPPSTTVPAAPATTTSTPSPSTTVPPPSTSSTTTPTPSTSAPSTTSTTAPPAEPVEPPTAEAAGTEVIPVVAITEDTSGNLEVETDDVADLAEAAEFFDGLDDATHDVVATDVDEVVSVVADPLRSQQYALNNVSFEAAWSCSGTTDGSGVVIAVVDTGVMGNHPDLNGKVQVGFDAIANVAGGNNDPNGHGTHVAGIAAAYANNGAGIHGGAPGAEIMPIKVLGASGSGWSSDVAQGIIWAADNGAHVINLSLGGGYSSVSHTAVQYAVGKGVVVVAAAGNSGRSGSPPSYPGALSETIAVGATDAGNNHPSFSNVGSYLDLSAPGVSILSTTNDGSYGNKTGTSMATPYVAAAAAIVRSASAGCTVAQVQAALEATADDLGAPGHDSTYGHGLIDPLDALATLSC